MESATTASHRIRSAPSGAAMSPLASSVSRDPSRKRTSPTTDSLRRRTARTRVERFFNQIEHRRRIATRYDKLAANYLAFVQLASIRLWLRVYEFTT